MKGSITPSITILLVEDNAGDAKLIRELLSRVSGAKFTLECVDRLDPALARLQADPPDVVLLDLGLPDSQGHETFDAVHDAAPEAPIIVLTNVSDDVMAVRVVHEGAQDYLLKGQMNGQVLWRAICYAIERQRVRVQLRAAERRWKAIISTALDAVIIMDAAGIITDWNQRAETMFGWPAAAAVGRLLSDTIVPLQHRAAHQRGIEHFLESGAGPILGKRVELTALRRNGAAFPVELTVTPIRLDDNWLFCAFLRDISDRHEGAREIRQLHEDLEGRVADRTAALAAVNHDLEAFTYSVSHDLRAPLRHVSSFVRILVDEFNDTLDPKAQHYLKRIEDGAQRMSHLVDDLLTLARVGKQDLQLRATPLTPIVERIILALKSDIAERQIEWQVGELPVVQCDAGLMGIVLTNLLSNAVKYTRPRERAVIAIGQTTRDGEPVLFVRDNGVGFDMKYADKLFGVFQRLHRAEEFDGTGVGLATVQRIAHKHGWKIWAEALVDQGATFFFTFGVPTVQPSTTPTEEVA
jgi:PAS domain S-box-containing protein